ncbi:hypothetical protein ACFVVX_02965 [Kitasatospora sp. NPDC058170]|uniref:hypothetical protein n=1 Tax=Kitasatospora sp. NPDC058170 TaxID=3346364 RepID=UPI0036DA50C0
MTTDTETSETETPETPANPVKLTAREKKEAEIRDLIERVPSVVAEDDAEKLENLRGEAKTLIGEIRGSGAAGVKAKLRNDFDRAIEKAEKDRKAVARQAAASVVSQETVDYTTIEGMTEMVEDEAQRIRAGVEHELKFSDIAKDIARASIRAAVRVKDKNGNPDFHKKTNANKQRTQDVAAKAGEAFQGDDNEESRKALGRLLKSVQNQNKTALVEYVRDLDNDPEEAKLWERAIEANPEASPSEAVFSFYGIENVTSNEQKALDRAAKKALAELAAESEGDDEEDEDGETEEETEGETAESAALHKVLNYISKAGGFLANVEKKKDKLTAEEKAAAKAELDKLVSKSATLAAMLNQ